MTITSGLPGVGKTHLAINIALEQVRRGRQAGIFFARESAAPIEDLLQVQQPVNMLRRSGDATERGLLRSGYQGIDIISCGTPLREWPIIQAEQRSRCITEMDVQDGYDDFLIDTSGMDARTVLACCRAAGIVIVVVTPESQSRAEAFALIRVLQLNGFTGQLRLLVNKVSYPVDVKDIHDEFFRQVQTRLGLDIPLLGVIPRDENVRRAQHSRQAFTSIYPDSEAAAGIVVVADTLEDIPQALYDGPRTLPALWQSLIDVIQQPVILAGDARLDDEIETAPVHELPLPGAAAALEEDAGLLDFQGNLTTLSALQDRLQANIPVLLADLQAFTDMAGGNQAAMLPAQDEPVRRELIISLVSRLLEIVERNYPMQSFRFRVKDAVVTRPHDAWLQSGRYLNYGFHLMEAELPESAGELLAAIPAITMTTGTDGEVIYELIDAAHRCSLSVVCDPQSGVRIQAWLDSGMRRAGDVVSLSERRQPAG